MTFTPLAQDVVVGRMVEGALQTQVSVRAGKIVIGYSRRDWMQGFEVSYTPDAIENFNDIVAAAAKVARGVV